jgi:glycosyltransferase involved in cell wall biosynthesis
MRNIIHIVHWEMSGIYGVAKTLQERGKEVGDNHQIITLRKSKDFSDKVRFLFRFVYSLFVIILSKKDIIHSHSFLPFLLTLFAKKDSTVFTFHNAYPFLKGTDFKSRLKCRMLKLIIKCKKPRITGVGKLVCEYIKLGVGVEAKAIPNGIDINQFVFTLPHKKIETLGSVGRLDLQKNYSTLVEAFSRIDLDLEIAGEGVQREKIESIITEFGISNVILKGFQKDVVEFQREVDGFVCSSLYEGFSLALIESILLGKPVISTNVGVAYDFPELDFPRLGYDVASMRKGIKEWLLLSLDDLQEKAIKNRNLAEHLFNITHIYEVYKTEVWQC